MEQFKGVISHQIQHQLHVFQANWFLSDMKIVSTDKSNETYS